MNLGLVSVKEMNLSDSEIKVFIRNLCLIYVPLILILYFLTRNLTGTQLASSKNAL